MADTRSASRLVEVERGVMCVRSFLISAWFNTTSSPWDSMKHAVVLLDEDGERIRMRQRFGVRSGKSLRKKSSATVKYCLLVTTTISSWSSPVPWRFVPRRELVTASTREQLAFQPTLGPTTKNLA